MLLGTNLPRCSVPAGSTLPWEHNHPPGSVLSPTRGVLILTRAWGVIKAQLRAQPATPQNKTGTARLPAPFSSRPPVTTRSGEVRNSSPLNSSPFRSELTLTKQVPREGGGPDTAHEGLLLPTEQPQTPSRGLIPIVAARGCQAPVGSRGGRGSGAGSPPLRAAPDPRGAASTGRPQRDTVSGSRVWFTRGPAGQELPGPTRWRNEAFTLMAVPKTRAGPGRHGSSLSPARHGMTRALICAV